MYIMHEMPEHLQMTCICAVHMSHDSWGLGCNSNWFQSNLIDLIKPLDNLLETNWLAFQFAVEWHATVVEVSGISSFSEQI